MRVAVVLGAAVWAGGVPSPALDRRARHAAALWRTGRVQAVIGCGGVGAHPPAEAEVIATILRAEGVPAAVIHTEADSTSTRENLRLAGPILQQLGAQDVVIVTDLWHLPRALLIARQEGLAATGDGPPWSARRPLNLLRQTLREALAFVAALLRIR